MSRVRIKRYLRRRRGALLHWLGVGAVGLASFAGVLLGAWVLI